MKVALVHLRHASTGGTERYLNELASFLATRGDDVTIVCRRHEEAPHPKVRFVRLHGLALTAAARVRGFARDVEAHVAKTRYDVVYGLGKTATQDVIRLGGGCHQTYLDLAHEWSLSPWEKRLKLGAAKHAAALEIESKALARGAYRFVVVNSELVGKDVMKRHHVFPELLRLIYNGVDLERFHPKKRAVEGAALRRTLGLADTDFVTLFLGNGYGRKGLDRLLKVWPQVASERPNARLLVVGGDSQQARYEAQVVKSAGTIKFLGARHDVDACYAASDLYVLPTRYDPFANSTLEAMASGLPVITTGANGAAELIQEDENGIALYGDDLRQTLYRELIAWSKPERARAGGELSRRIAERHPLKDKLRESAAALDEVAGQKAADGATRG